MQCEIPILKGVIAFAFVSALIVSDALAGSPFVSEQEFISAAAILPQTKKAAEDVASKLNLVAGASSVVAASCAAARQAMCGGLAAIVSGTTWLGSGVANHLALELGDAHYDEIIKPNSPSVDFSQIPASTKPLATSLVQAIGLVNAIYTTANRATMAVREGSNYYAQKQYSALLDYQKNFSGVLIDLESETMRFLASKAGDTKRSFMAYVWSYGDLLAAEAKQVAQASELTALRAVASCLAPQSGYVHRAFCSGVEATMRSAAAQ